MNPDQVILGKKHSTTIRYSRKYVRKEKAATQGSRSLEEKSSPMIRYVVVYRIIGRLGFMFEHETNSEKRTHVNNGFNLHHAAE